MLRRQVLALFATTVIATPAFAQSTPRSATVEEAHQQVSAGQMVLIDVRTPQEWAEGGSPKGAVRIDMNDTEFLNKFKDLKVKNPGRDIGLICRTGNRSTVVQTALAKVGYSDIVNVRGGMSGSSKDKGWLAANLPVDK